MNVSPRVSLSLQVWETAVGKGVVSILQGRISRARWTVGQVKSPVQQGRASGSRCQGRSAWCGAALWCVELGCLSSGLETASVIPLKVVHSVLLGLFNKCLGTPGAKWGICPGACGWYMAVLLDTPAGKCGVSPGAYLSVGGLCRHGCSSYMWGC